MYGYEILDEIDLGGGKYLSLKKKGDTVVIRLASEPKYRIKHWVVSSEGKDMAVLCEGDDCQYCGKNVPLKDKVKKTAEFGWIVIDRTDNKPKIYKAGTSVARAFRDLSEDVDWGDPFLYDIRITRTEEPGAGYYKVTPLPTGKGSSLTEEEKTLIANAAFNLEEEMEGGKDTQELGKYANTDLETVTPATPVTEDDIPF